MSENKTFVYLKIALTSSALFSIVLSIFSLVYYFRNEHWSDSNILLSHHNILDNYPFFLIIFVVSILVLFKNRFQVYNRIILILISIISFILQFTSVPVFIFRMTYPNSVFYSPIVSQLFFVGKFSFGFILLSIAIILPVLYEFILGRKRYSAPKYLFIFIVIIVLISLTVVNQLSASSFEKIKTEMNNIVETAKSLEDINLIKKEQLKLDSLHDSCNSIISIPLSGLCNHLINRSWGNIDFVLRPLVHDLDFENLIKNLNSEGGQVVNLSKKIDSNYDKWSRIEFDYKLYNDYSIERVVSVKSYYDPAGDPFVGENSCRKTVEYTIKDSLVDSSNGQYVNYTKPLFTKSDSYSIVYNQSTYKTEDIAPNLKLIFTGKPTTITSSLKLCPESDLSIIQE